MKTQTILIIVALGIAATAVALVIRSNNADKVLDDQTQTDVSVPVNVTTTPADTTPTPAPTFPATGFDPKS